MAWKFRGAAALDEVVDTLGHASRTILNVPTARNPHPSQHSPGNAAANGLPVSRHPRLAGHYHESGRPRSLSSPTRSSSRQGAQ